MRLKISNSKINTTYSIIRDIKRDGKRSTEIVEILGSEAEICNRYNVSDAKVWALKRVEELNLVEKEKNHKILIPFSKDKQIDSGKRFSYNAGYLFLQRIYYQLGLPTICKNVTARYGYEYDLDNVLSRLVYGRILYPSSKLSCMEQSKMLLEAPKFELHHIYRALSVLAKDSDYIQSELYKRSRKLVDRKTGVLFYDCTNYFFEIEQEEGLKQYGPSKEHRPLPIVQMGLLIDKTGIPLAFCINKGNQNEQLSLKPLEEQVMRDFELSKFVICTDAGLSSAANRKFNNYAERSFITTQSLKNLKKEYQDWALDPKGWRLDGSKKKYDISKLEENEENKNKVFYKQQYIEDWDEERDISFNQNLIVTYSLKYKEYQAHIREKQVQRAETLLLRKGEIDKRSQTDAKRFLKKTSATKDGEIADMYSYEIDQKKIDNEAKFDGFYAVCTNLDDDPAEIAKINKSRWEIEESFRIMKTEFEARPVFLQRDDRIEAHFLTCFIALLVYRILEKQLDEKYTCEEIIKTLRTMNMTKVGDEGYIPAYTRTEITDSLHDNAGFRTDYEITTKKGMAGVIRRSKGL